MHVCVCVFSFCGAKIKHSRVYCLLITMCLLSLPKLQLPTNTFPTQCYESVQINMGSSKTMTLHENTPSFIKESPKNFVEFSSSWETCVLLSLQNKKHTRNNIPRIQFWTECQEKRIWMNILFFILCSLCNSHGLVSFGYPWFYVN